MSEVNQYLGFRALLMDGDIKKKNNNPLEALKFPPGLNPCGREALPETWKQSP